MSNQTLCFIKKENQILMINRNKKPFMGMWNAVGGHIEPNETAKQCAIREIFEESHIKVKEVQQICSFTWNYDDDTTYVFLSELDSSFDISNYPLKIDEGIIDFKDIDWILNIENYGIIDDLRVFLKDIKNNEFHNYHLIYDHSKLIEVIKK